MPPQDITKSKRVVVQQQGTPQSVVVPAKHHPTTTKQQKVPKGDDRNIVLPPSVEDVVCCGTDEILQSVHVSEGPGKIHSAPVPSVYRDDRGEIHRVRISGGIGSATTKNDDDDDDNNNCHNSRKSQRMNILSTKARAMRSGYLHSHNMYYFVISGKVEVWTLTASGTTKRQYGAMESIITPPYVPQILHFVKDTVLCEWWDPNAIFECWYYHPYRRIVDVQNSLVSQNTGQHQRLIPQDDQGPFSGSYNNNGFVSSLTSFFWWTTGMAMGMAIGAAYASAVARRR